MADLGFARAADVGPDPDRPGVLRARTLPFDADPKDVFDFRRCALHDLDDDATPKPELEREGFETLDLTAVPALAAALARVRAEDRITDDTADALRTALRGERFPLAGGGTLDVVEVADDGLIMRRAGPNGLDVNPEGMVGANGHDGAGMIHADQDVFGTPLAQLMNGAAPDIFRHRTPDAVNADSTMFLLNVWIPLQQITRPLVFMDRTTLDAPRHQLRYGLPVTGFLERNEDQQVNDIWHFLPDPDQRWYFRSAMGPDRAYVFDTLGTPHGSCVLPGEDVLEVLFHRLGPEGDDGPEWVEPPAVPAGTTAAIREAARHATGLLRERDRSSANWLADARIARDGLIRKSVEMRIVATLVPGTAA